MRSPSGASSLPSRFEPVYTTDRSKASFGSLSNAAHFAHLRIEMGSQLGIQIAPHFQVSRLRRSKRLIGWFQKSVIATGPHSFEGTPNTIDRVICRSDQDRSSSGPVTLLGGALTGVRRERSPHEYGCGRRPRSLLTAVTLQPRLPLEYHYTVPIRTNSSRLSDQGHGNFGWQSAYSTIAVLSTGLRCGQ